MSRNKSMHCRKTLRVGSLCTMLWTKREEKERTLFLEHLLITWPHLLSQHGMGSLLLPLNTYAAVLGQVFSLAFWRLHSFPSGRQNFVKKSLDNILYPCREQCFRAYIHLITHSLLSQSLYLSSTASGHTNNFSVSLVFLLFCLKSLRNSRH